MRASTLPTTAFVGVCCLLALTACNSKTTAKAGTTQVEIALTDKACDVSKASIPAGPVTFSVKGGSSSVTEAELVQGSKIVGEKENVPEGLTGTFTLTLQPGSYNVRCPGGSGAQDQPFTVTGSSSAAAVTVSAQEATAIASYQEYVKEQVAQQVTATKAFTDAVRSGSLTAAAAAYPAARVNYERIEPVAESFGDIDPDIDARIADVPSIAKWTGYHRLEYAIFKQKSLAGMTPIANKLDADVTRLNTLVQTVTFTLPEIANGASELLDEVAKSKITGEEENYSHVDLLDFQANVDGAETAFDFLKPALATKDDALSAQITAAFTAVNGSLTPYRTGTKATDFKRYENVTKAEQKNFSNLVDALAEPLSKVAAKLVTT